MDLGNPYNRIMMHRALAPIAVGLAALAGWGALSALAKVSGSPWVAHYGSMMIPLGMSTAIALTFIVWVTGRRPVESLSAAASGDTPNGDAGKAAVARMLAPLPIARSAIRFPSSLHGPGHLWLAIFVAMAFFLPERGVAHVAEAIALLVLVSAILIFGFTLSAETRPASEADYYVACLLSEGAREAGLVFPPPDEARAHALGGHAYLRDYVWAATAAMIHRGEQIMADSGSNTASLPVY